MGLLRNLFSFKKRNHTPLRFSLSHKSHYPNLWTRVKEWLTSLKNIRKKSMKQIIDEKLTFRTWLFFLLSFSVIGISFFLLRNHLKGSNAVWAKKTYQYRVSVDITNVTGGTLPNEQVGFTLNTATLISSGKMQSDCDDIRITDINGNDLKHWIEENNPGCNSATTKIWTKLPSLSTGGETIYVYYGNSSATNVEDPDNIFLFFEDFNGEDISSLQAKGWVENYTTNLSFAVPPAYSVSSGELVIDNNYGYGSNAWFTKDANLTDAVFVTREKQADHYIDTFTRTGLVARTIASGTANAAPSQYWYYYYEGASNEYALAGNGGSATGTGTYSEGTWYTTKMIVSGTGASAFLNTTAQGTITATSSQTGGMGAYQYESEGHYDYFYAYQYASTDPTGSINSEEQYSIIPGNPPVSEWKFDESGGSTAYDSVNSNHGTLGSGTSSPTWIPTGQCVEGSCLYFDGTNDVVNISTTSNVLRNVSQGTVSLWAKVPPLGSNTSLIDINKGSASGSRLEIVVETTGNVEVNARAGDAESLQSTTTTSAITFNKWYYITGYVDYTHDKINIYFNGVRQPTTGSVNFTAAASSDTNPTIIKVGLDSGGSTGQAHAFIDDIKVYNYGRTDDQIKADYTGRGSVRGVAARMGDDDMSKRLSDGLVGWWKMDEETGTTAYDTSDNNNDLTLSSSSWTTGRYGVGWSGVGSNYLSRADDSDFDFTDTDDMTISLWYKSSSTTNSPDYLFTKYSTGSDIGYYLAFNGSGILTFATTDSINSDSVSSTSDIYDNLWHNVIIVKKNKIEMKMYVDGVLQSTDSSITSGDFSTGTLLYVGSLNSLSNKFSGSIDEVRVYRRAFTSNEVTAIYNWAPGPVGYWKLDENNGTMANDSSGIGTTGSFGSGSSSPSWTSGKFGSGLSFDGSSDYVSMGDAIILDGAGSATLSAWVKFNSLVADGAIIRKYAAGQQSFVLGSYVNASDEVELAITDGSGNQLLTVTTNADLGVNKWYYITGIWSGGNNGAIYVNGISQSVSNVIANAPSTINNSSEYLMLGARYNAGSPSLFLNGSLDDAKIYNYARTSAQIIQDMNANHPAPGSPVGSAALYYRFDEGYGRTVNNAGNLGSTLNGNLLSGTASPTWTNDGRYGKALSFDGSLDGVNIPQNNALSIGTTDSFTISSWIQSQSSLLTNGMIYSQQQCTSGIIQLYLSSVGVPTFRIADLDSTQGYTYGTKTLNDNNWHHLTAVRDVNQDKTLLYIDGMLNAQSTDPTAQALTPSTDTFRIGNRYLCGDYSEFKGKIDEFKFFRSALTADQVKVEYHQGKSIILGASSTGLGGTSPDNSASRAYCVPGDSSTCSAPVGEWNLDEGIGGTANDTSGNGYVGNFGTGNSAPIWTTGKVSKALSFDGTSDQVQISGLLGSPSAFTLEAWVNQKVGDRGGEVISLGDNALIRTSTGTINGIYNYGASWRFTSYSVGLTGSGWNHIAFTVDPSSSSEKLYFNGVGVTSSSYSDTVSYNQGTNTFIGKHGNAGSSVFDYKGLIDGVRVYNYVRTPAQVAWDYNQGKPVAWYRMDEGTGSIVYNAAKNANGQAVGMNGTLTIGGSGTQTTTTQAWTNGANGKYGGSLNFDGTDDVITITESSPIDVGTTRDSYSVAAWFKTSTTPGAAGGAIVNKHDGVGVYPYRLYMNNTNQIVFILFDGSNFPFVTSPNAYNDNEWHYAVGVRDVSTDLLYLYMDGVLVGTTTDTTTTSASNDDSVAIGNGCSSYTTCRYKGQIDEVKIFNYPLTKEQVRTEMAGGAVRFQ